MLFWLFFAALAFGYMMGASTVYLHQWLGRRWVLRHTRDREWEDEDEGYTLRVMRSPGDYVGEDAQEDEEV